MIAYAYLRVSGINQVDGDGFDRQLLACRGYADTHDLTIARIFHEEGISGTKELDHRPALQSLLLALEENGVTMFLIERLDRLARDLMIQETIIADLRKRGITIVSVAEPDLCIDDPTRKLMRQIFGAIAEYDRSMIVSKLRGARQRTKLRDGRCEGQKPFGHYPGEEFALHDMVAQRMAGRSFREIADTLNQRDIPTRSKTKWSGPNIAKILRTYKKHPQPNDVTVNMRTACAGLSLNPM